MVAKIACIVAVLMTIQLVQSSIPIPKRAVGWIYADGNPGADIQLSSALDLLCPYSKEAYPTLKAVAEHYGGQVLGFKVVQFPLPYHHNAFLAAKGTHLVHTFTKNMTTVFHWMDQVFMNQDMFSDMATYNMAESMVVSKFATIAGGLGIPQADFIADMMNRTTMDEENARIEWKYCCTRGVAGTPSFMLNDVMVEASPTWTLQDWMKVIDPLIAQQRRKA